jgi:DNA-binding transcriptional MerR regulator
LLKHLAYLEEAAVQQRKKLTLSFVKQLTEPLLSYHIQLIKRCAPNMSDNEMTSSEHNAEYSIDELARVAGATVRNVRAYQDRGILPPPERRGRSGIYTDAHLARLRMIGQLLGRGYSIANIGELIAAWEQGQDVSQLLGLESAITSPWSDETPSYYEALELLSFFGKDVTQEEILTSVPIGHY